MGEFTFGMRTRLRGRLFELPADKLGPVIGIVRENVEAHTKSQHEEEVEIDIGKLPDESLQKLQKYVDSILGEDVPDNCGANQHPKDDDDGGNKDMQPETNPVGDDTVSLEGRDKQEEATAVQKPTRSDTQTSPTVQTQIAFPAKKRRRIAVKKRKTLDEQPKSEWSAARSEAFRARETRPNKYYYRHNKENETQQTGPWEPQEEELMFQRIRELQLAKAKGYQWGVFSIPIPGRVGYQCRNHYSKMVYEGRVVDPNYTYDPDTGKLSCKRGAKGFGEAKIIPTQLAKKLKLPNKKAKQKITKRPLEQAVGVLNEVGAPSNPQFQTQVQEATQEGQSADTRQQTRILGVDSTSSALSHSIACGTSSLQNAAIKFDTYPPTMDYYTPQPSWPLSAHMLASQQT